MNNLLYIVVYFAVLTHALPWINEASADISTDNTGDVIAALPGVSIEIDPVSAGIDINPGSVGFTGIEIVARPTGIVFSTNFGSIPSATISVITSSSTIITSPAAITTTFVNTTNTSTASTSTPTNSNSTTLNPMAIVTGSVAVSGINGNDGSGPGSNTYTLHTGDGSPRSGYPSLDQWVSFDAMFDNNVALMKSSCGDNREGASDSPDEIDRIRNAVESVAQATRVDHRFILAIIMQESTGCVRVNTTVSKDHTVRNPGLMQDHDGVFSCQGVEDCSQDQITGMVLEGTGGTAAGGTSLAGALNTVQSRFNVTGAQAFYFAARTYNSGSVADPTNLGISNNATSCYVSDVANRLTGALESSCTEQQALG